MKFKNTVQQVKSQYDIVDYIKLNGVDLESAGNGQWKGLCPFHNEKTPSFTVSEDFQNYKCFGCGVSGDILSFAEYTHTISFFEALKMLAEEKGIVIDDNVSDESSHNINAIRNVVKDSETFFRNNYLELDDSHPAKQQVILRGLDPNNELYGYSLEAPSELYRFLSDKGHTDEDIKASNLVMFFDDNRTPWDFFHGRLMITISDYLGRPITFQSRKIYEDDKMKGKYVNGKESPLFHKKSNLFGSSIAKKQSRKMKEIFVVEGQFDQISMFENGIENVVATSGTAFTNEHANLLLRMVGNTGRIVFIMDGDDAGIEAALKIFTKAETLHSNAHAVLLSDGKDPCDYIEEGVETLEIAINNAIPLHDFVIDSIINSLGGTINIKNRQRFVSEVTKYAKSSDNSFIIDSMLSKASVISAISIGNVKEIYKDTKADKVYKRREDEVTKVELKPDVELDMDNEADLCMFSALALLVRMPGDLIDDTATTIHKKFIPFYKEVKENYETTNESGGKWRFIAEDYTDSDFAKTLQDKDFLGEPKEDVKSSLSQYKFLLDSANSLYRQQHNDMKRANAMSSIIDSTDAKEIAKALTLYKESV